MTSRREFLQQIKQKEEKENTLNEEMSASLEELTATNEELGKSMYQLSQSREYVRTIIEQAPVGIAMLKGPEHILRLQIPLFLVYGDATDQMSSDERIKMRDQNCEVSLSMPGLKKYTKPESPR